MNTINNFRDRFIWLGKEAASFLRKSSRQRSGVEEQITFIFRGPLCPFGFSGVFICLLTSLLHRFLSQSGHCSHLVTERSARPAGEGDNTVRFLGGSLA